MTAETSWDVNIMVHITAKSGIDLMMEVVCDGRTRKNQTSVRLGRTLVVVSSNK